MATLMRPFAISSRFYSPIVHIKSVGSITGHLRPGHFSTESDLSQSQHALSSEEDDKQDTYPSENGLTLQKLAEHRLQKSSAVVDVGSVYVTLPKAEKVEIGKKPKPRYIVKEKDWPNGFPDSPEEANTDILTYLDQKDMFRRSKTIDIPEFCVGSIIAVTRAEPYSRQGLQRFVGICIGKKFWYNTSSAAFCLRNVIDGEPLEITFQTYSPIIQKIEVLRHETRNEENLYYLRDYPPSESYVPQDYKGVPYTEEPRVWKPPPNHKENIKRWFELWFEKKRKRH